MGDRCWRIILVTVRHYRPIEYKNVSAAMPSDNAKFKFDDKSLRFKKLGLDFKLQV